MLQNRTLWVLLSLVVGGLQAWDSGVLQAGPMAQALIALGFAAPALALALTAKWHVWVAALVTGAVLLAWGRFVSPVSLNAIHIGLMVPAMYIFFVCRLEKKLAA